MVSRVQRKFLVECRWNSNLWKLGLVGVDLLEDGVRECWPGESSFFYYKRVWDFVFFELKEWDVVEILAGHRVVGQEGQCGTIQEDSCQELASVVMEKIYTEEISMEVQLKEWEGPVLEVWLWLESSSGGRSLRVNLLGNGSGGASSTGQASACAGEERPSLFSDSGNRLPHFNPFATAFASLGPAERYEAEFMGASEFLNRRLKNFRELLKQGYLLLQFIHLLRYIILELQVIVPHQKVFEVHYLMELHQFHLIQHHLQFRLGLRPQFSLQVQHLWDCRALQEGCLMLEVLWHRQDFLWGILREWQDLVGYLWMTQFLEFLLEIFLVRIQVIDLCQPKLRFHLHLHNKELEIQLHSCLWGRVQWAIFWFKWHRRWIIGL